eukprot:7426863-Lingulodinium_polyedra.AAC.1
MTKSHHDNGRHMYTQVHWTTAPLGHLGALRSPSALPAPGLAGSLPLGLSPAHPGLPALTGRSLMGPLPKGGGRSRL